MCNVLLFSRDRNPSLITISISISFIYLATATTATTEFNHLPSEMRQQFKSIVIIVWESLSFKDILFWWKCTQNICYLINRYAVPILLSEFTWNLCLRIDLITSSIIRVLVAFDGIHYTALSVIVGATWFHSICDPHCYSKICVITAGSASVQTMCHLYGGINANFSDNLM